MTSVEGIKGDGAEGFTLLEMLIVLAIGALVLALAIPTVNSSRRGMTLKTNTLALVAQVKTLRSTAVNQNAEQSLLIDVKRNLFWAGGSNNAQKLAPDLRFSAHVRPHDVVGASTVRLRFHPDGTASRGTLVIRDGNQAAQVSIDWRTGAPRITWSR